MEGPLDDKVLAELEAKAVELAWEAGKMVQGRFGAPLEIEYKDEKKLDPVTSVDKESQAYLYEAISRYFPGHGIVGEEGPRSEEASASDFLWVLDPLDGTTNFLNGLPVYAVSIGVLHRGAPVAGALFIPWPGKDGGQVLHARKGGGAWRGGERISIFDPPVSPLNKGEIDPPVSPLSEGGVDPSESPLNKGGLRGVREHPEAGRLVGLPGSFGARFRLRKGIRRHWGEVRVTGSIAYELALTSSGALQYVVLGGPRVWDVAAGVLIVMEAGGSVVVSGGKGRGWESLTILGPSWEMGRPSMKDMYGWAAPMIAGEPRMVTLVATNLGIRHSLRARVANGFRKLVRGRLRTRG